MRRLPDNAWWRDAVVYQIYPRSFQDSDGDGEGDLRGIAQRLDHVVALGADAIWLSPVYPSPMADGGYDVADYTGIDPRFGSLADFDALVAQAHERGLRVLMDVVPSHTSIEHPWFTEHPERYIWSDRDGPENNWVAAFGGGAWSPDPHGRGWYLHSFYPEQPDLDWRRQDVRDAVSASLGFWVARGVDGFRLDAIDRLLKEPGRRDDPPATGPPALPELGDGALLQQRHSRNAPDIGIALRALREGAGEDTLLVGEVYLPAAGLPPYLEHIDAAFAFELLHAPWEAGALRAAIAHALDSGGAAGRVAWVLSNHDFSRLPDRVGARNARAAALLALTLPGPVFVYQGDEIGMADGPGREPPDDRAGRDRHRHPMRWDDDAPHGGFTTGEPWLPAIDVEGGGVAAQDQEADSALALYRDLIALRPSLGDGLEFVDGVAEGIIAYRRGTDHLVALNVADEPREMPPAGPVLRATHAADLPPGAPAPRELQPGVGVLVRV
ncbi:MAG TPA: alpha-amylase family glycosyl hydrolase [Solirubrobacteraceae bacterium]|nr:alpha-amylase family glycosyl hydrolase [Solirubrobacteraceae bacterium]